MALVRMRYGLVFAILLSMEIYGTGEDDVDKSGMFIESDVCRPGLVDCAQFNHCFDHTMEACLEDGNRTLLGCDDAYLFCPSCFPNSRCGSTEAPPVHESAIVTDSFVCGACADSSPCFHHDLGNCQVDGSMTIEECLEVIPWCQPCFPNSGCGSTLSQRFVDVYHILRLVLSICSALLSAIGSSMILFKILRSRAINGILTPYNRIILGLSSCDLVASIVMATNDFLSPREVPFSLWGLGSPTTCQFSASLYQLSVPWAIWYNGILSFYFLLTVLSQKREKDLFRKHELLMHLSGIFFPVTAIMGLVLGWYNMGVTGICKVTELEIAFVVYWGPIHLVCVLLIIDYCTIYAVVRKSLRSQTDLSEHGAGPTGVKRRLMKEVTTIMLLYVGCFFVTTLPMVIFAHVTRQRYTGVFMYILILWMAITFPLQGFFNALIYIKPAYTRFRAVNRHKSIRFVLHQVLFNPDVPQLYFPSNLTGSHAIHEESEGFSSILFESHRNYNQRTGENEIDDDFKGEDLDLHNNNENCSEEE